MRGIATIINQGVGEISTPLRNKLSKYSQLNCKYYPCHDLKDMSCLFCFCPLHHVEKCPGRYTIINGIKDCSKCLVPHRDSNYEFMIKQVTDENNRRSSALQDKRPNSDNGQ